MATPYSEPAISGIARGAYTWPTRTLPNPPPTWGEYLAQNGVNFNDATNSAARSFKCPPELYPHWRWVVRIFTRNLSNASDEPGRAPNVGVRLKATWTQATASFVRAAHPAGAPAQYLLTAAHNFVNRVYQHNDAGIITSMASMESARADTIFVVAALGPNVFTGWVDRVSVMAGYLNSVDDLRNDGAALHIANSNIPPEFWSVAPRVAALPPTPLVPAPPGPVAQWNQRFVVAGYPGMINRYANLAGFYICGVRPAGAIGADVANFGPVQVTKNFVNAPGAVLTNNATVTWDERMVETSPGLSGSPGVMLIPGAAPVPDEEVVVSVLNTSGVGAGFGNPPQLQNQLQVDPQSLLLAVGAVDVEWESWALPNGLGNWWVLRRR